MSFNDWIDVPYDYQGVSAAIVDGDRCGYESEFPIVGDVPPQPWTEMLDGWRTGHVEGCRRRDRHLALMVEASTLRDWDVPEVPDAVYDELKRAGWLDPERQRRARENGLLPPDSCF